MKHFSAAALERAAKASALADEEELRAKLRARLMPGPRAKFLLAASLGVETQCLTKMLRGQARITDDVAERLGFRRVVRFEPIES
jgi:hypothetical protein